MAYSGALADNTKKPSSMTDVGFCQTTGTITGRITYANGNSAVDNVRVTLDAGGDNPTDYSKLVEGASWGVTWDVDNTATAKLFKKANTVQMFVRPDSAMSKGVLGSVPGMGHFQLEKDAAMMSTTDIFSIMTSLNSLINGGMKDSRKLSTHLSKMKFWVKVFSSYYFTRSSLSLIIR